ncbi:MAG: TfoX/Sxy family protein [Thermoplasmatota archaeon]
MPNDPILIERLRDLAPLDTNEKQVFGARCWTLAGNMAFGVHGDELLVRLGSDGEAGDGVRPFDPMGKGKPMKGWFLVDQELLAEDDELAAWIERAVGFAATLPPK